MGVGAKCMVGLGWFWDQGSGLGAGVRVRARVRRGSRLEYMIEAWAGVGAARDIRAGLRARVIGAGF